MPDKEAIAKFFVRGRKVKLPDGDYGVFLKFRKITAECIRGIDMDGGIISVPKDALIEENLGEW